jgi:rSAM/selenodomain-associated transferase 2
MSNRCISVIIPTLNEAHHLPSTLASCRDPHLREVIVVDGGSTDGSAAAALRAGAGVLHAPRGRASQMNRGVQAATAPILLFLHADTRLPEDFGGEVVRLLNLPGTIAGAFRLRIEDRRVLFRLIEKAVDLRSRWFGLPYGDQALFLYRRHFEEAGGFPEIPILEDIKLVRGLHRSGKIRITERQVLTSSRRWDRTGLLRLTAMNQIVLLSDLLGVAPERIAARYRRWTSGSTGGVEKSEAGSETFRHPPAS